MNKRHSLFNDCVKELKFVFRDRHDTGEKRTMKTPEKEILSQNLDRFVKKWSHITRTGQGGEDDLFRPNFIQQITNLKEHISSGCLSGIPPGYSTSINESLHEKLNDLFAGAKMGPELALALLTIFFYSWNSRRTNKKRGIQIVKPLSSLQAEQANADSKKTATQQPIPYQSSRKKNLESVFLRTETKMLARATAPKVTVSIARKCLIYSIPPEIEYLWRKIIHARMEFMIFIFYPQYFIK